MIFHGTHTALPSQYPRHNPPCAIARRKGVIIDVEVEVVVVFFASWVRYT